MARGITETDVWNACDALLLEGGRPTIERVRQKIGSGSPNTVSPFLDTWFKHLGARIKDPGAFSVPPGVPDPVLHAAKHFWEAALAETRSDFDERLRDGLASAIANVEAEKETAAQANAAAFEAASKLTHVQTELKDRSEKLDRTGQTLAAESARLAELRTHQTELAELLRAQEERATAETNELREQLQAAVQRADAADRRVAMELERERTARAKAERQAESLQKSLDAARSREEASKVALSTATAELLMERQRSADLRDSSAASAAEAFAARTQVLTMQSSVDRLATLVEAAGSQRAAALSGDTTN